LLFGKDKAEAVAVRFFSPTAIGFWLFRLETAKDKKQIQEILSILPKK